MSMPSPVRTHGPRVIVVGAGIVGTCCALALADRGAAVTLVDADARQGKDGARPRSASAAAAGMLGAYSEAMYDGPTTHRLLSKLCAAGLRSWDTLLERAPSVQPFVRRTGTLMLAHGDADVARLLRVRDRARALGAEAIWTDELPVDLDIHLYSLRVRGALRLPMERLVDAVEALEALQEALVDAGGSILREREVSHLAVRGGRTRGVAFEDGSGLVSDAVVLATGALATPALVEVAPALQRLTPAKGALGAVEPVKAVLVQEMIRTIGVYAVPGRYGELVFGATMEEGRTDLEPDDQALQRMFQALRRALPGAKFEGPPRFLAAGIRPMSPDWAPLIGPSGPDGCFVACGHSRNGWMLAPLTGEILAAQVLGGPMQDLWSAFHPDRFEKKAA